MAKRGPKVNEHTPEYHSRISGFAAMLRGERLVMASKATSKPAPTKPVAKAKAPAKAGKKKATKPVKKNDLLDTEAGEATAVQAQEG
jgi:hypothetical protein